MFIQNIPFLTTISRRICYRTVQPLPNRSTKALNAAFDEVFRVYNRGGYTISRIYCDPEFRHLRQTMADIDIDLRCAAAQEHVSEIERSIRVIKERFRSMYHRLPFQSLPRIMIKIGAMECARWLNTFPAKQGISDHYSPRMIVTGKDVDYEKQCKTAFGAYVQALHETNPTNTMAPRTIGCIYLRFLDSNDSGYELINLVTNKVITRRKYTEIPTLQNVIERVEQLAKQDGMRPELIFRDRKGRQLRDESDPIAGVVSDEIEDPQNDDTTTATDDAAPTQATGATDDNEADENTESDGGAVTKSDADRADRIRIAALRDVPVDDDNANGDDNNDDNDENEPDNEPDENDDEVNNDDANGTDPNEVTTDDEPGETNTDNDNGTDDDDETNETEPNLDQRMESSDEDDQADDF